ncbi:NAD(P)-binding domain-containing protein [Staphylococcus aureus]|nr:NAD(P)-binding domain-containing protein [Staphylococcus aureus]
MTQQIGVIGLAVMGKNLAWNIESRGYSVSVFNRSSEKTDLMVEESKGKTFIQRIHWKNLLIL